MSSGGGWRISINQTNKLIAHAHVSNKWLSWTKQRLSGSNCYINTSPSPPPAKDQCTRISESGSVRVAVISGSCVNPRSYTGLQWIPQTQIGQGHVIRLPAVWDSNSVPRHLYRQYLMSTTPSDNAHCAYSQWHRHWYADRPTHDSRSTN